MSETLMTAINMMWQGMLGLFVVMIVIALIVLAMSKIGGKN